MFAKNLVLDIRLPIFLVQSMLDSWEIMNILGFHKKTLLKVWPLMFTSISGGELFFFNKK